MSYKFGLFSTFRDEEGYELVKEICESVEEGEIEGEVSFIFSNKEEDKIKNEVKTYNPDLVTLPSDNFKKDLEELWKEKREKWRNIYDREVMKRLEDYEMDLGVLVGYMLIVGSEMCEEYDLINLHPAPPRGPKGKVEEVMEKLAEEKEENPEKVVKAGAQIHLVTEVLDEGPPITYYDFEVEKDDTPQDLREKEYPGELPLIITTLKKFGQGELEIKEKKPFYRGKELENGLSVNEELEEYLP